MLLAPFVSDLASACDSSSRGRLVHLSRYGVAVMLGQKSMKQARISTTVARHDSTILATTLRACSCRSQVTAGALPCSLQLDGGSPTEHAWAFSPAQSDLSRPHDRPRTTRRRARDPGQARLDIKPYCRADRHQQLHGERQRRPAGHGGRHLILQAVRSRAAQPVLDARKPEHVAQRRAVDRLQNQLACAGARCLLVL